MQNQKNIAASWFELLRDKICTAFEDIEKEFALDKNVEASSFERKSWKREGGGGEGHVFNVLFFQRPGAEGGGRVFHER